MWKHALFLVVTTAVLVPMIRNYIVFFGYNRVVYSHYPGKCALVEGTEFGSEDFHPVGNGKVIITSGLRSLVGVEHPAYKHRYGKLLLFDTTAPQIGAVPLELSSSETFDPKELNPHGISAFWNENGDLFIYVINHLDEDTVEKFLVNTDEKTAKHLKTIKDPLFTVINDLTVVGEDVFYVTNFVSRPWSFPWEMRLGLCTGSVVYFDGSSAHTALAGMQMPNGIVNSKDGRTLFLNLFYGLKIVELEANGKTLKLKREIPVHVPVDNLHIHEEEDKTTLYAAAFPQMWRSIEYSQDPDNLSSSSQVLRVTVPKTDDPELTELFADDGKIGKSSTVAMVIQDKLLIGALASHAVLCDMECKHS